jgi:hypothetical protein
MYLLSLGLNNPSVFYGGVFFGCLAEKGGLTEQGRAEGAGGANNFSIFTFQQTRSS